MHAIDNILARRIILTEVYVKFQPDQLKTILEKVTEK